MDTVPTEREPVLISALNQYVFCPRRCALMHVEGMWRDNEHTVVGALLHERADEPGYEAGNDVTILRALPLWSEQHGLAGMADIVEVRAGERAPVEYKKGKRRKFDNDDVQLCAQGLCLAEMFACEAPFGYVYHSSSRRRRKVLFDSPLRAETVRVIEAVREMLALGVTPPAELKPRCEGCSLRGVCMPELTGSRPSASYQRELQALWSGHGD